MVTITIDCKELTKLLDPTATVTDSAVRFTRHVASAVTIFAICEVDANPCGDHAIKVFAPTSMFRLAARPDIHNSSRSSLKYEASTRRQDSLLALLNFHS
jgi:hypothetical protein